MARGIAHREWAIPLGDFTNEFGQADVGAFRAAVENEQALNVHIQERLGVAIVSAPIRRRAEDGSWYTAAYVFQTASVPAAREQDEVEEETAEEREIREDIEQALFHGAPDDEPAPLRNGVTVENVA